MTTISTPSSAASSPPEPLSALSRLDMLLFKKKYLEAIRSGGKTQTLRLWSYRRMRTGQRSYIPGAGYIEVNSVEEVGYASLDSDDARRDGFASLEQLQAELASLYEHCEGPSRRLFRVRFRLLPAAEQERLRTARRVRRRSGTASRSRPGAKRAGSA